MTPGQRLHLEPVVRGDLLRGLRGALDRARVDRRDRQLREPLRGRFGLPDTLLRQVDARHATRQQRTGVRGDRVAHEHEPRRRLAASRLGVALGRGRGSSASGGASVSGMAAKIPAAIPYDPSR